MALKVEMVTFDCSDPVELAAWWAAQFDGETRELMPGEFVAVVRAEGPTLGFQRVPDPTPASPGYTWTSPLPTSTPKWPGWSPRARRETGRHPVGENFRWVVLEDPAGNAFCVAGQGADV